MLLASVETRWLREASAVKQHGALRRAIHVRGIGLPDHGFGLVAEAVVVHPIDEGTNDKGEGESTEEEPKPSLRYHVSLFSKEDILHAL